MRLLRIPRYTISILYFYITYRILHRKCLQLALIPIPWLLTLEYFPDHLLASLDDKYALCYSSSRFKAQMKWPIILKGAFIRLTLSGRGIHRITVQITCYFNRGRSGSISETLRYAVSLYGYG